MSATQYHSVQSADHSKTVQTHQSTFPWPGLGAILLALGCGITALIIGLVSNGQPLNAWKVGGYDVQPSVLLAIAATVANALLAFAFAEGACLSWWTKAQYGTTLKGLHATYEQANSLPGLFTHLSHLSKIAFASIAMLVLLMDSPLLQRASAVRTYENTKSTNLSLPVSPDPFQFGATGIVADHADPMTPEIYHPAFSQIVQQYNSRSDIVIAGSNCTGKCSTEIIAPGWDVSCNTGSMPYRLASTEEAIQFNNLDRKNQTDQYKGPSTQQVMFETNVTMSWDYWNNSQGFGLYKLNFYNMHKSTPGGNGTMQWHNCTLSEALIRYPVNMVNQTATLQHMPTGDNRTVHEVYRLMEDSGMQSHPSTIGGFWLALNNQYTTQANITPVGNWMRIDNQNAVANQYISSNATAADLQTYNVTWSDPLNDMLSTIHELSFRAAVGLTNKLPYDDICDQSYDQQGNPEPKTNCMTLTSAMTHIGYPNMTNVNRTLSQTAAATQTESKTVYHTRSGWLAGGFAVIALACMAVASTFWGWWKLQRKVSMSPLEIARAFDAPLLRGVDGHGEHGDGWLKSAGGMKVQCTDDGSVLPVGFKDLDGSEQEVKPGMNVSEETSRSDSRSSQTRSAGEEPEQPVRRGYTFRSVDDVQP